MFYAEGYRSCFIFSRSYVAAICRNCKLISIYDNTEPVHDIIGSVIIDLQSA